MQGPRLGIQKDGIFVEIMKKTLISGPVFYRTNCRVQVTYTMGSHQLWYDQLTFNLLTLFKVFITILWLLGLENID